MSAKLTFILSSLFSFVSCQNSNESSCGDMCILGIFVIFIAALLFIIGCYHLGKFIFMILVGAAISGNGNHNNNNRNNNANLRDVI